MNNTIDTICVLFGIPLMSLDWDEQNLNSSAEALPPALDKQHPRSGLSRIPGPETFSPPNTSRSETNNPTKKVRYFASVPYAELPPSMNSGKSTSISSSPLSPASSMDVGGKRAPIQRSILPNRASPTPSRETGRLLLIRFDLVVKKTQKGGPHFTEMYFV